jgi:hypothetical protein
MAADALPTKLAALGFTLDDWCRIRESVEAIGPAGAPPALWDLSVPIAVAAVRYDPRYPMTDALGIVTRPDGLKVKLICWPMSDHDRGRWEKRRAAMGSTPPAAGD